MCAIIWWIQICCDNFIDIPVVGDEEEITWSSSWSLSFSVDSRSSWMGGIEEVRATTNEERWCGDSSSCLLLLVVPIVVVGAPIGCLDSREVVGSAVGVGGRLKASFEEEEEEEEEKGGGGGWWWSSTV